MEALTLIYLAAGPGIAIAVYLHYSDKWEPEPKALVARSFLLGALAWFPSEIYQEIFQALFGLRNILDDPAQFTWWQIPFYAFFGVALSEELCKFLFLKSFIYDNREFNEPFDGIVYGGVLGCGFATLENMIYVFDGGYAVGIVRMMTAVPGHAFEGMILGYFMGRAKFCPIPGRNLARGLLAVIFLHGTYNSIAFTHAPWAIYPAVGLVALGIYLGLRAKKELAAHSRRMAESERTFYVVHGGHRRGPLTLRDLSEKLSDGRVELDDVMVDKSTGERQLIKDLLCSELGLEHKELLPIEPREQPVGQFMLFYGLTLGLYLYFWFYRNYHEFKGHRHLKLSPERRTLVLYGLTLIPYFVYGAIMEELDVYAFPPAIDITFNFLMVAVETALLYFLLRVVHTYICRRLRKGVFNLAATTTLFFFFGALRKLLPLDVANYWWFELALIWMQGGILAAVQRDINRYWIRERGNRARYLTRKRRLQ
ncbi:MAG: PrsW family intramembrane metalloprotease [Nitrospinaceae bacterium]|nr:MAG: PrsW family intramembrane metalloprotease [Nitrospinaceae bacterium]